MILSKLSHSKCIDHRYYNFVERIEPLRIIGERRDTLGLSGGSYQTSKQDIEKEDRGHTFHHWSYEPYLKEW